MRWLKSFRFRSRTVPKFDPEAKPPKRFSEGIDLLGKALAGDIVLDLKPIEGTDQSPLLDQMIEYLAPKPPPGEQLSDTQLNLKNRITTLLKSSRLQKLDEKAIKKFKERWNYIGEIINGGKHKEDLSAFLASEEAKKNLLESLKNIDTVTFSQMQHTELNSAVSSISGDLPPKTRQIYDSIPSGTKFHILEDGENKNDLMVTYTYLQTFKPSEESTVGPLENLVRDLPQDGLDLGPRFIRYTMMIQFENILQEMGRLLAPNLKRSLQNKIDSEKIGSAEFAKSLFASPDEKDVEWRKSAFLAGHTDKLKPSDIFKSLEANADDKGRIKYALHRKANSITFLEDREKDALNLATDRKSFRNVIKPIKERYPDKSPERKTLDELESKAINTRPANHPYAQELYEKGYIDQATLAKLNPSEGYFSKDEFATRLGTEQELEKVLYDKFEATVLERMNSHQKKINDGIVTDLTNSYLDQLTTVAQDIYLKPDAILKPDSFKFDEALRKFDPAFLDELVNLHPPDFNKLKKDYVDAAVKSLGASSTELREPSTLVTKFLDAMKIPPVTLDPKDTQGGIVGKKMLSDYDARLYEIYLHPVTAGDSRLRGTQFENLPEGFRIALNNAVKDFFDKVGQVDAAARQVGTRAKQIKQLKASFNPEEISRLEGIINEMLKTERPSRFARGGIH